MGITTSVVRHGVLMMLLAALPITTGLTAPSPIPWETRIDPAAARSRETGKPILVEFWATWCEACKGMDEEVYSDPAVARAMTKILPVRIDVDRESAIARRYDVSATPTLVLTDAGGNELFRFTGRIERDPLLELLRELPGDVTRINHLAAAVAGDTSNVSALEALARELRQASLYVASNRYYDRALHADGARRDKAVRGRLLAGVGENYAALKRPDEAVRWFENALRDLRGQPGEPEVLLDLARAQIARGQTTEARATLDDLRQRFKGTPSAVEAARLSQMRPGG